MEAKKRFAVFDIDGTLIRWQLYHAVTDELAKLGYVNQAMYNKIKHARLNWKVRFSPESFKAYEAVLVSGFEQVIKTLSVVQFETAVDHVINQYKDQVYTYTRKLIRELKEKDYFVLAISGSQIELVERIAAYYDFDDYIGTDYLKHDGKFTGKKKFYAQDKKIALQKLINQHGLTLSSSMAIGDSHSDIAMLEMVEQPIVFNPEHELFIYAKAKSWPIVVERKNVIYRLEVHNGHYTLQ